MSLHTLMFGWEYPPLHLGGLGVACQGLVNGLTQNGVQVTLALPHSNAESNGDVRVVYPTDEHYDELKQTIKVASFLGPYDGNAEYMQRIEKHVHKMPKQFSEIYGQNLHEAIYYFTEMSVEMTKHVQPDVVHCHDWMTYEAGSRAAQHHNRPLVAHIHATELDRTHFSPNQWIYERERTGFQCADRIIAVSQYTKDVLVNHYGIAADKIHVVYNGSQDVYDPHAIQIRSERTEEKKPMILFLGRLALQKGARQFLDMAAMVHRLRPEVQFVVAGDGHMFGEMIDRCCELGLQDNVIFAGKVGNAEARKLYEQASCFVMPSLSEPFGLVALEAIARGTPVILSKQSGASEVISHSFKVDFWDTEKMADCALTILRDQPLAQQLRCEAPRVLQRLTWENQAGQVHSIYRDLIRS